MCQLRKRSIAQARLKNDKLDSDVLADLLRSEMVYESFVPEKYYRDLRSNMEEDRTQNHELTLRKKMESKSQTS
ncbi:MAG: hypothetical protein ABI337_06440 [Nitrososphaera sp.]